MWKHFQNVKIILNIALIDVPCYPGDIVSFSNGGGGGGLHYNCVVKFHVNRIMAIFQ